MAGDSVITDEMKAAVGVESEPSIYEIERSAIRRWAEAVGDPDPRFHDEEYARGKGYRGLVAPPGFIAWYAFPNTAGRSRGGFRSPFTRTLNGGNEYELFEPIQAGDTITATNKLVELFERDGRMGKMLFTITETTYKNQDDEIAVKARRTDIY